MNIVFHMRPVAIVTLKPTHLTIKLEPENLSNLITKGSNIPFKNESNRIQQFFNEEIEYGLQRLSWLLYTGSPSLAIVTELLNKLKESIFSVSRTRLQQAGPRPISQNVPLIHTITSSETHHGKVQLSCPTTQVLNQTARCKLSLLQLLVCNKSFTVFSKQRHTTWTVPL